MNKRTLTVGLVAVCAASLTACGNSGDGASGGGSTVAQEATAPITVWVDDTRTAPAKAFAAAHTGLKANVVSVDNTHGNISSQISLATKAGDAVPDVVFLSNPDEIANLVVNPVNYALPMTGNVDQKVLDGFAKGSTTACTFGGKVYCLPNDLAQTVLYYNKTLFTKFGYAVPTTFDDFKALGEKLADDHPGYSLGSVNGRYGLNAYYGSSGCEFNDSTDPTKVSIDTSSPACTRVQSVIDPLLANGTLSSLDPFDAAFTPILKSGKLLATISPVWMGEYGIKPNYAKKGDWAAAPMPTWGGASTNTSGAVGGGIWLIAAKTKNKAAAVSFVTGMTSDPAVIATASGYPADTASASSWLTAVAKDSWYAEDPTSVYRAAAAKISPTLGFVRYQVQLEDSFNATIIKGGGKVPNALQTFGQQAKAAAEAAGYTVESGS